jgi:hypothetical protein
MIGVALMLWLDRYSVTDLVGLDEPAGNLYLGALGLAVGAAVSAWYELLRLSRSLTPAVGALGLSWRRVVALAAVALLSSLPGVAVWYLGETLPALVLVALTLGLYGSIYLGWTRWLGFGGLGSWFRGAS